MKPKWAPAVFCLSIFVRAGSVEPSEVAPTFNRDVAPLLHANCAPCHRPEGSGPFSLLTYSDAVRRARQIVEVTQSGFMPPWQPAEGYGQFKGARRLSGAQRELLRLWVEHGALEGEEPAPTPPDWPGGWESGPPDLVIELEEEFTLPAAGADVFRNFILPIPLDEGRFVRRLELRPGNPKVVHHAVMQIASSGACRALDEQDPEPGFPGMDMGDSVTPPGQILSWTPGRRTGLAPDDLGWWLPGGSELVLQMHMVPSGKPEPIRPTVGFYFADHEPEREAVVFVLRENHIDIPAGKTDYEIEDSLVLPTDAALLSLYPHAHYLARDVKAWAELPDGHRERLLWIPDWDFNWQDQYWFREPVHLPAGSKIVMRYLYDNSTANPRNPHHPPRRVVHGPRSSDEMANLAILVVPSEPEDLALLRESQLRDVVEDPSNPGAWLAHLHLGRISGEREGLLEALKHFKAAVRLAPEEYEAHFFLAETLHREGRLKEAVKHYRAAANLNRSKVEVLNNLGAALGQLGRGEEAIEAFRGAVRLRPDDPRLRLNLGNALGDRLEQAIEQYRIALDLEPEYAEAHNSLGIALTAAGQPEQALRHFERALEIRPDYEDARTNAGALRSLLNSPG